MGSHMHEISAGAKRGQLRCAKQRLGSITEKARTEEEIFEEINGSRTKRKSKKKA